MGLKRKEGDESAEEVEGTEGIGRGGGGGGVGGRGGNVKWLRKAQPFRMRNVGSFGGREGR